ncbi:MAG: molecular chaperone Hsp33 [Myxococcota bacterium]|jgi:molecular chaperone Hsp33
MTDTPQRDSVIRAITDDGSFRVITLRTHDLVQEAIERQGVEGNDARLFGELLTGAILVRETMSPGNRVQAILSGVDGVSLVADSWPDAGRTRGLVSRDDPAKHIVLGEGAILKVIRTLPRGELHQSIVEADSSGVSEALMGYMQNSEQVMSTIRVACVVEGGRVVTSGGYIVQLLPECQREPLMVMTERLADFSYLDNILLRDDANPTTLVGELLYGFPHSLLSSEPCSFGCDCSEERVMGALITIPRDEIASMVARSELIELKCEYCKTPYSIAPRRLLNLLTPA